MRKHCIACGGHITYPIFQPDPQPLAFVNLPHNRSEALIVPHFPMNYRACGHCGHIFNVDFEYFKIPYEENSTQMYNQSKIWQNYMQDLAHCLLAEFQGRSKTFIDIGCGDGTFLKILQSQDPSCEVIGFEPGIEAVGAKNSGLNVHKDYFIPERDLKKFRPDFLICRHVVEHLENPREFVSEIAYWANRFQLFPYFVGEVPRIDKAIKQCRMNDYLYEHVSNFTDFSFENMFRISGFHPLDLRAVYDDEVILGIFRPIENSNIEGIFKSSIRYHQNLKLQKESVHGVLAQELECGSKIAFWGGAGKGASFLNCLDIEYQRFPLVVDSDLAKVGRFVPGMAQKIESPDILLEEPVDVIIITTQWRAKDIVLEIKKRGIPYQKILVLLDQELREFS